VWRIGGLGAETLGVQLAGALPGGVTFPESSRAARPSVPFGGRVVHPGCSMSQSVGRGRASLSCTLVECYWTVVKLTAAGFAVVRSRRAAPARWSVSALRVKNGAYQRLLRGNVTQVTPFGYESWRPAAWGVLIFLVGVAICVSIAHVPGYVGMIIGGLMVAFWRPRRRRSD
jgi:type IV secretory pathway TrbD component